MLGQQLPVRQGIYTYRFDFRGCGDSSDVPDPSQGRLIKDDVVDLHSVVRYFESKKAQIAGVVGHSRGSVAMFLWAVEYQARSKPVPNLVNVSGRYKSPEFFDRINSVQPGASENGYRVKIFRHGKYVNYVSPIGESRSVGNAPTELIEQLSPETHVLSVYGSDDRIINLSDINLFDEALSKLSKPRNRHTTRLIRDADHNFYQFVVREETTEKVNHNQEVSDLVCDWLDPANERERFLQNVDTGRFPRWHDIEGVYNFRDLGNYSTKSGALVRPGIVYRCGNPAEVTAKGKQAMCELGIATIFDLRSIQERASSGVVSIDGIETRWSPVFRNHDMSPAGLAKRAITYAGGGNIAKGFAKAYTEILDNGAKKGSFAEIMEHIRDRPDDALVIHCTAGKDRTGVICALILLLMGVDADTVAREYELTTLGLAGDLERLSAGSKDPRLANMLSSKYESMRGVIEIIKSEYGGAEGYFKTKCGLSDDDLSTIKKNLTAKKLRYMI
ncbi:hypothetical protein TRVA0_005S02674 [Trichomonascus vanleenenianus]|uniref:uncharacterized protein n=1 Tax=Trichomonascus vanleenenianus TaxID=2268995 RepID=UPI003ECB3107